LPDTKVRNVPYYVLYFTKNKAPEGLRTLVQYSTVQNSTEQSTVHYSTEQYRTEPVGPWFLVT